MGGNLSCAGTRPASTQAEGVVVASIAPPAPDAGRRFCLNQYAVLFSFLISAGLLFATPHQASAAVSDSLFAQPTVSASQAAAIVRSQHGGRVLSVVPSFRGKVRGYRVRVLIGGERVKTVFIADQRTRKNKSGSGQNSANGLNTTTGNRSANGKKRY